ncbi:LodA/GoxA family CTQ-dependent oxidase, partial [Kitasatospora sp. NPDC007106]|uniref:LodA/GoxA family CTQ-dependent oxidase n=1 Tax=Kitasatospora sp. NPDC007106 TaxID=3156914 RepID=UPI0033CF6F84
AGFYGHQGLAPFVTPEAMQRLSSTSPGRRALRRQVFNALRDFGRDGGSPVPWPWLYGDGMAVPPRTPLQHMALSPTQYRMFQYWADGEFEDDWGSPDVRPVHRLADLPVAGQPAALDRAALDFCLADAFHPGCEVTWPIRHPSMYMAPFRIRHRSADRPEPSYGTVLTPETALSVNGPLYAQGPGDLTRWMAVPWQTDTASCRSGYELALSPRHDPYLPTFWPARVPNHVLTEEDYRVVADEGRPLDERTEAFERRAVWLRGLKGQNAEQLNQMIDDWYRLGIVEVRHSTGRSPGAETAVRRPPRVQTVTTAGWAPSRPPVASSQTCRVRAASMVSSTARPSSSVRSTRATTSPTGRPVRRSRTVTASSVSRPRTSGRPSTSATARASASAVTEESRSVRPDGQACTCCPVAVSQTRTVVSRPADTTIGRPSTTATATAFAGPSWPVRVRRRRGSAAGP